MKPSLKRLTAREMEILTLLIQAKRRHTISEMLRISVNTVDKHINHIYCKTQAKSPAELIIKFQDKSPDY